MELAPLLPAAVARLLAPVVTRAALDPALVADRGASVNFLEQEAENAATNGTVIGPDRTAYTLPAEASGRTAVQLTPGQYVEFTLPKAANAINVRYSIPDAPNGGGITAPLDVTVNGKHRKTMTLTSQYAWLYNQYSFTNDPNADLLHPDWWITECQCVPAATTPFPTITKPFRPMHFYDEQRLLLGRTYKAGDKVRLTAPTGSNAAWTVIDLLDSELVGAPKVVLKAANVLLFGADPRGKRDSADAFDKAVAFAQRHGLKVYVPPGTYQVNRHIIVDNVTIVGAGSWYTIIKGKEVALETPAPDGSVHTGVGFYGKDAAAGGSNNVHLSGFAIEGDVRERIDTDQVNGIGGAMSNSTIDGLYIRHTKVGLWFDGPMTNVRVTNNIIVDQIADALNFHIGVTNSVVSNNFVRNTGDDGLAMWSEKTANANNTFDHNTVQTPTLANGIAIYGGTDNTVSNNLIADPIREGSGIQVGSRFGAEAFVGRLDITNNTVGARRHLRAELEHRARRHLDLRARQEYRGGHQRRGGPLPRQHVQRDHARQRLPGEGSVLDHQRPLQGHPGRRHRHPVVSARVEGGASFENVDVRNVGGLGSQQLRIVPLPADRLGVHVDRRRRQRWRRQQRVPPGDAVARAVRAQYDHLQRPTTRRGAAGAVAVVMVY